MTDLHPYFAPRGDRDGGPEGPATPAPGGSRAPLALAHRGFSLDGLENSMAAFRAAVDLGFRHLETDVHTTADGVLVLFHDKTLDRITAGRPQVSSKKPQGGRGAALVLSPPLSRCPGRGTRAG